MKEHAIKRIKVNELDCVLHNNHMAKKKNKSETKTKIISVRVAPSLYKDVVARKIKIPRVIERALAKAVKEADEWMPIKESK